MEVSLFQRVLTLSIHMSMQGVSNGADQWCPVNGGGYIAEVSQRFHCNVDAGIHCTYSECKYKIRFG